MEENKTENSCGCGSDSNDSCCTPKSNKKKTWTTIIFVVVIIFAGLLISYKMFCPEACKGDGTCAKDSVSACCAGKNAKADAATVPACCSGKSKCDSTSTTPSCCAKK